MQDISIQAAYAARLGNILYSASEQRMDKQQKAIDTLTIDRTEMFINLSECKDERGRLSS
jgi:hypothetical protein